MLVLGSCLALNLNYSGCCVFSLSPPCNSNGCYCDQNCYIGNDCCSDIADIGCHPLSPTPTDTLGKRNLKLVQYISHSVYKICDFKQ